MKRDKGMQPIGDLFGKTDQKKPPAYEWQDLALTIIGDLKIPGFKRGSVFKVCKEYSKEEVLKALNDTKELCPSGEKWKYFFKVVATLKAKD